MPARTKVIVAGCVCIDISPEFRGGRVADIGELLRPGKLIETGKATISPGGAVSNTGLALKALGEDVVMMARTGDDLLGDTLSGIMAKYGVEDSMIRAPGEDTAYSVVLAIPGIDRIFLHDPGANHTFCTDDIPQEGLKDAAIFHFGYPPLMRTMYRDGGDELIKVMSKAKAAGCITSLDMAMADPESEAGQADWPSILKKVLPLTDIFVPSFEELLFMLDRDRYDSLKAEAGKDDIVYAAVAQESDHIVGLVEIMTVEVFGLYAEIGGTGSDIGIAPVIDDNIDNNIAAVCKIFRYLLGIGAVARSKYGESDDF